MTFSPNSIKSFRFKTATFDYETGTAHLGYALDDEYHFTETIRFIDAPTDLSPRNQQLLERALQYLHLAAGVSYYKTCCPSEIVTESYQIDAETAEFFNKLYIKGLGEFSYRNEIDLTDRISFPSTDKIVFLPLHYESDKSTYVVPIGGGKDSLVTLSDALAAHQKVRLITVGDFPVFDEIQQVTGLPRIKVERKLDPLLFKLNSEGALNGHVPISSILHFIFLLGAPLYRYSRVALSNERSANVGNTTYNNVEVNHQYSKSLEFEQDFSRIVTTKITRNYRSQSVLREESELEIAERFAKLREYHPVFTSCNKAFRIASDRSKERWCLNCPKCRFVFLVLAPFLPKNEVLEIFGANLLDQEDQASGFEELLGLKGFKPFECVGEIVESQEALTRLLELPEWKNDFIVKNCSLESVANEV